MQTGKINTWIYCFGVSVAPPAETIKTPKAKRMGRAKEFSKSQKDILCEHIKAVIADDTTHFEEIWDEILAIEKQYGKTIIPRSKSDGKLMAKKTFRDYVNRVKRDINLKGPKQKKEIVFELHKSGLSESQIKKKTGISLGYINRILVISGFKKSNAKWYKDFLFKELEKTNNGSASL